MRSGLLEEVNKGDLFISYTLIQSVSDRVHGVIGGCTARLFNEGFGKG